MPRIRVDGEKPIDEPSSYRSRRKITPSARRASPESSSLVFERLLDEISSAMSRVPAHEIDDAIEKCLREIVLALDIDGSTVWERIASGADFVATHWWGRPDVLKMPNKIVATEVSRWATSKVLAGETVSYSSIDELKDPELKRFAKTCGPAANVTIPLESGGVIVGSMSFGKFRGPRDWPSNLVRRLRVVGQIIASALDRKRTFVHGRRLREELTLASRRSMMGQLAASIAHELNQPLTAMLSNVNAIQRMFSLDKFNHQKVVSALSDIAEDTKRAGHIIRRVRALFNENSSPDGLVEPGTLMSELDSLLRSEAMLRRVLLRIEAAPSLPSVRGDRVQLQQCILNLVLNAFDSIVTDSARREVLVRVHQEQADWVTISVRDTGRGIEKAIQARLFEPFVTTKPNGMGMGLLVTRCIVERHGGKISGKSNADMGATFTLMLPATSDHQRKEEAAQ
jgi:signal transduction histidine kinase